MPVPYSHEEAFSMRRKNLLAAGMLTVLLATSACGAVTGAPNSTAQSSGSASAGVEASSSTQPDKSSTEVGASQRAAAEKAEAAAAAKAEQAEAAAAAAQKTAEEAPAASPIPAAVPAPAVVPAVVAAAPKPAPAPVQPASSSEHIVNTTYTTAYTWHDNTPVGSAAISHPVLHQSAGGTGTYADPITIAVGHSLATGEDVLDFPAGTRIYLPDVRRYFIVEDTCGDGNDPQGGPCHQGVNAGGTNSTIWIDMWIGGESMSADGADECASKVTDVKTAVFNPASNYAVAPGAGVIHDGKCDAGYGGTLVKQ
jgi:hypothetical protein